MKYGLLPILEELLKCKTSIGAESTSGDGTHICQKSSACCYGPTADGCPVISCLTLSPLSLVDSQPKKYEWNMLPRPLCSETEVLTGASPGKSSSRYRWEAKINVFLLSDITY